MAKFYFAFKDSNDPSHDGARERKRVNQSNGAACLIAIDRERDKFVLMLFV